MSWANLTIPFNFKLFPCPPPWILNTSIEFRIHVHRQIESERQWSEGESGNGRQRSWSVQYIKRSVHYKAREINRAWVAVIYLYRATSVCVYVAINWIKHIPYAMVMIESSVSRMPDILPCPRSPSWVDLRQAFFLCSRVTLSLKCILHFIITLDGMIHWENSYWIYSKHLYFWRGRII